MKVSQVMMPEPACCLPQDSVDIAARLMRIQDVGMIPVVEGQSVPKLVGVLTDRDLALLVVAPGREPRKTKVCEVMTRNVVSCNENDSVQQALDSMKSHQVRRIPVLSRGHGVVGVVSQSDIALRLHDSDATAEVVAEKSRPSFSQSWQEFKNKLQKRWDLLTEDDLEGIFGDRESLITRIQERYSLARQEAEQQVNQFWQKLSPSTQS